MIAYILLGLGAYLVYDDYKAAQAKKLLKKGGAHEKLSENGSGGTDSDSGSKSHTTGQKSDRERSVSPIGVPAQPKGVNENEIFNESIQQVEPDTPGDSVRDNSGGQPDTAPLDSKTKGVTNTKGDKHDAGNENNLENGTGNDGDNVDG